MGHVGQEKRRSPGAAATWDRKTSRRRASRSTPRRAAGRPASARSSSGSGAAGIFPRGSRGALPIRAPLAARHRTRRPAHAAPPSSARLPWPPGAPAQAVMTAFPVPVPDPAGATRAQPVSRSSIIRPLPNPTVSLSSPPSAEQTNRRPSPHRPSSIAASARKWTAGSCCWAARLGRKPWSQRSEIGRWPTASIPAGRPTSARQIIAWLAGSELNQWQQACRRATGSMLPITRTRDRPPLGNASRLIAAASCSPLTAKT